MDFANDPYLEIDSATDYSDSDDEKSENHVTELEGRDVNLKENIAGLTEKISKALDDEAEVKDYLQKLTDEAQKQIPFYDKLEDDLNQNWVEENLRVDKGRHQSDAALSCPGCFTVVCMDCQQHSLYKTQYRAMFVLNCKLLSNQKLYSSGETLIPVACKDCGTELGVKGIKSEIYEFFHVLPSTV